MKAFSLGKDPGTPINYNMNIFLMFFGRLVSALASSIFNFVLGLYILDLTGSASLFSLTLAVSLLPSFFVYLFGGVLVDRYNKKVMIVASDLLSGVFVFVYLLLFWHFSRQILLFILYPIILNILQSFFSLALNTSIPNIASDDKVAKANSGSQAISSMMGVIGPLVGALIYKQIGMSLIFVIYGSMLIVSGISECFLRFNNPAENKTLEPETIIPDVAETNADCMEQDDTNQTEAGAAELNETNGAAAVQEEIAASIVKTDGAGVEKQHTNKNGIKSYMGGIFEAVTYIFSQKILVFFFVISSVVNMLYYPLMSLVMPFINYHVLKVSGLQMSVVSSAGAAGIILGAVIISLPKSANGFLRRFFVFYMLQGVLILLWAFPKLPYFAAGNKWAIAGGFAVLIVMSSMMNIFGTVPMVTYFQVKVPEMLRGRVLGIFSITFSISAPIGLWLIGIAMEGFDWVYVTAIAGVLTLAIGIVLNRNRIFRAFVKSL